MQKLLRKTPLVLRITALIASVVGVMWFASQHDATLQPAIEGSEYGIVDFELARTTEQATAILDDWGSGGRLAAENAIQVDFGLLVAYSLLLALSCGWVAEAFDDGPRRWVGRIGWWLAGASLAAGLLDAIENTALLGVLRGYESGGVSSGMTLLAAVAASLKFIILFAAAGYVVLGLLGLGIRWLLSLRSVSRRSS